MTAIIEHLVYAMFYGRRSTHTNRRGKGGWFPNLLLQYSVGVFDVADLVTVPSLNTPPSSVFEWY